MSQERYDEIVEKRFGPPQPTVIWGALMAVALTGAGVTVWRAQDVGASGARMVVAGEDRALKQDVARLTAARDELQGRLASLERGIGELKLAARAALMPETTGSISRAQPAIAAQPAITEPLRGGFGLSLGPDATLDAVKRRWTALSARYPQQLAKLSPRAQRSPGAVGVYDLVAGPFSSRTEADKICSALADQGVACDTTSYAGDPIGRP